MIVYLKRATRFPSVSIENAPRFLFVLRTSELYRSAAVIWNCNRILPSTPPNCNSPEKYFSERRGSKDKASPTTTLPTAARLGS
jgi:hypothetical protein